MFIYTGYALEFSCFPTLADYKNTFKKMNGFLHVLISDSEQPGSD